MLRSIDAGASQSARGIDGALMLSIGCCGPSMRKWLQRNAKASYCVQLHVRKILASLCCLVAMTACARTVEGRAVVDDAWDGHGVTHAHPTTTQAAPVSFDPCEFDEITLRIAVGVDPSTKIEVPGGCAWSGDGIGFAASLSPVLPTASLTTTPGVTDLRVVNAGSRVVQVFAYEGDTCAAVADIGSETLQLTMLEDDFSAFCIRLGVAATLLLEDV
jgi:hypothetical protein